MRIFYSNDQLFPSDETDTEQILQTVAAISQPDIEVTLCLPARSKGRFISVTELEAYYQLKLTVQLKQTRVFGSKYRWLTKIIYPLQLLLTMKGDVADILYTRNLPTVVVFLLFSRTPVIYETYRPWQQQSALLTFLLSWMARHPRLAGVITHSEYTRKVFLEHGYKNNNVKAILNGYDSKRMQPVLSKASAREQLNVPTQASVVVYTGHISEEKGCATLLQMASLSPDILFFLVGSTGNGAIEKKAQQLNNVHIVKWLPFSETTVYLYMADVLIIPPTKTPLTVGKTVLPIKTYLYMAAGRPILAPFSPDTEELLRDGENCALVDPDDPPKATTKLQSLFDNPKWGQKLALKAKKEVVENFSYRARGNRVLDFIRERLFPMRQKQKT